MSLETLNKQGVCCSLYVGYPKYRNRLSLDMFRLRADGEGRSVLKGPGLNLLNDEMKAVAAAERRARAALADNTLPLELQIGLHFCPVSALPNLLSKIDAAKAEFQHAAAEFIANFPTHVAAARDRWAKVVEQQHDLSDAEREAMLDYGLEQIPCAPPSRDDFAMSLFSVELKAPGIPSLADVDAAQAAAAETAARRVQSETSRRMQGLADTFVSSCRREVAGRVASFMEDMRGVVREGKTINRRTLQRTRDFLASIRGLNFFRDADIAEVLDKFQQVCFPGGMPPEDAVACINEDAEIKAVSDSLDEILADLSFSLRFSRDTDEGASAIRGEAVAAPAPRTAETDGAPEPAVEYKHMLLI